MFILLFMIFIFIIISTMFIFINKLIMLNLKNREKLSPFECGFDPFSSPRLPFSIQFYKISIIFLIFDIEIIIFIPIISSFLMISYNSWLMTSLIFIFILLFGLYLEWYEGALYWLK